MSEELIHSTDTAERAGSCPERPWAAPVALAALMLFHLAANLLWQRLDNRPLRTDEAVHMLAARDYHEVITGPQFESVLQRAVAFTNVLPGSPIHPPFLHVSGALNALVFGYSTDLLANTNTFYFLLALLGFYCLLRLFLVPVHALYCVFLLSFTPILYCSSRYFMTDFTAVALVVWLFFALVKTRYFQSTGWVFLFAVLNALAILTRLNALFFYAVPCVLIALAGGVLALRARTGRGEACARWVLNCALCLVISAGVAAPWYLHNLPHVTRFVDVRMIDLEEGMALHVPGVVEPWSPPGPVVPGGSVTPMRETPVSATLLPGLVSMGALHLERALLAQTPLHGMWERIQTPKVRWSRYPLFMVNNALFLPLSILSVLGMVLCLALRRYRRQPTLLLLLGVLSTWFFLTVLLKYSNPRYALAIIPALSVFAGMAVLAVPHTLVRRALGGVLACWLLVQFVHLSFVPLIPGERLDLPWKLEYETHKFYDPGVVLIKEELHVSDAFSPVGRPVKENFKERLLAAMVNAELSRTAPEGEYANYQRLNIRGMELDQRHYWPAPNPYLRKDLASGRIPARKLRNIAAGRFPPDLLPKLESTDYIIYALENARAAMEKEWVAYFERRGFSLLEQFELPAFGSMPARHYGVLGRAAGTNVHVEEPVNQ